MPQYDAYEEPSPITIPHTSQTHADIPLAPANKPLETCYSEGINKPSDTDTPELVDSPLASPYHFHRRHSTLSRDDGSVKNFVPSTTSPESAHDTTSPKHLTGSEQKQLAEFEASQKQDDEIRMMMASDRCTHEKAAAEVKADASLCDCDPTGEFNHEAHTLNGG